MVVPGQQFFNNHLRHTYVGFSLCDVPSDPSFPGLLREGMQNAMDAVSRAQEEDAKAQVMGKKKYACSFDVEVDNKNQAHLVMCDTGSWGGPFLEMLGKFYLNMRGSSKSAGDHLAGGKGIGRLPIFACEQAKVIGPGWIVLLRGSYYKIVCANPQCHQPTTQVVSQCPHCKKEEKDYPRGTRIEMLYRTRNNEIYTEENMRSDLALMAKHFLPAYLLDENKPIDLYVLGKRLQVPPKVKRIFKHHHFDVYESLTPDMNRNWGSYYLIIVSGQPMYYRTIHSMSGWYYIIFHPKTEQGGADCTDLNDSRDRMINSPGTALDQFLEQRKGDSLGTDVDKISFRKGISPYKNVFSTKLQKKKSCEVEDPSEELLSILPVFYTWEDQPLDPKAASDTPENHLFILRIYAHTVQWLLEHGFPGHDIDRKPKFGFIYSEDTKAMREVRNKKLIYWINPIKLQDIQNEKQMIVEIMSEAIHEVSHTFCRQHDAAHGNEMMRLSQEVHLQNFFASLLKLRKDFRKSVSMQRKQYHLHATKTTKRKKTTETKTDGTQVITEEEEEELVIDYGWDHEPSDDDNYGRPEDDEANLEWKPNPKKKSKKR